MLAMDLVMFHDALLNICRIVRVLRRPRGNLLLLGIGGSGRQSLVRLAAFICEIVIFQIEIGRRYGHGEFKEGMIDSSDSQEFVLPISNNRSTSSDEIMWSVQS